MKPEFGTEDLESDDRPIPVRRCHRGHGELTPEGTCPICQKRSWMYSPLLHLGYGTTAAITNFLISNSSGLLIGRYDFIYPFFLSLSMFVWGVATAAVQYELNWRKIKPAKQLDQGPYRRRLPCSICGNLLDEKNWCYTCSKQRSRALTILVLLLLPTLGMAACFTFYTLNSLSPFLYVLPIATFLPPIIFSVIQYTDCLPKKN